MSPTKTNTRLLWGTGIAGLLALAAAGCGGETDYQPPPRTVVIEKQTIIRETPPPPAPAPAPVIIEKPVIVETLVYLEQPAPPPPPVVVEWPCPPPPPVIVEQEVVVERPIIIERPAVIVRPHPLPPPPSRPVIIRESLHNDGTVINRLPGPERDRDDHDRARPDNGGRKDEGVPAKPAPAPQPRLEPPNDPGDRTPPWSPAEHRDPPDKDKDQKKVELPPAHIRAPIAQAPAAPPRVTPAQSAPAAGAKTPAVAERLAPAKLRGEEAGW